jgi:hypothetical protein
VVSFTLRGRFTPEETAPEVGWTPEPVLMWGKFFTLPELEFRPLGRPARSQSVYRLRYPGSSERSGRRRKGNLVLEGKTGPLCHWET